MNMEAPNQATIDKFLVNAQPDGSGGQVILYKKDGRLHALVRRLDEETVENMKLCKALFDVFTAYNESVYAVEKNGKYVIVFAKYSKAREIELFVVESDDYADPKRLEAAFPFLTPIGSDTVERALQSNPTGRGE